MDDHNLDVAGTHHSPEQHLNERSHLRTHPKAIVHANGLGVTSADLETGTVTHY